VSDIAKIEYLQDMIIELREQSVLLDSDVAKIYGVETKRVNEAVKNNPDKFPPEYMIALDRQELELLRSKFSTTKFSKTRTLPKAFTEKGLYMLATILRSKQAIEATFTIIETFSKLRELSRNVKQLSSAPDKAQQKSLMQRSGELIAEILDEDLQTSDAETSIELNFAVLKFKHTVKKKRGKSRATLAFAIWAQGLRFETRHHAALPVPLSGILPAHPRGGCHSPQIGHTS
jgi:hypothetical protein